MPSVWDAKRCSSPPARLSASWAGKLFRWTMPCAGPPRGSRPWAMPELAIVAALEREILPLVRNWRVHEREHSGRRFRFFESEHCVAVAGGIGAEAARRASVAVIALYAPAK